MKPIQAWASTPFARLTGGQDAHEAGHLVEGAVEPLCGLFEPLRQGTALLSPHNRCRTCRAGGATFMNRKALFASHLLSALPVR